MAQTVVLKVRMSCGGCSGAVQRVLSKTEGVESFDIDMKEQKVTVKTNLPPDVILETVAKTGKQTAFWEEEAPPPAEAVSAHAEVVSAPAEAVPSPAEAVSSTAEAVPVPMEAVPAPTEVETKAA